MSSLVEPPLQNDPLKALDDEIMAVEGEGHTDDSDIFKAFLLLRMLICPLIPLRGKGRWRGMRPCNYAVRGFLDFIWWWPFASRVNAFYPSVSMWLCFARSVTAFFTLFVMYFQCMCSLFTCWVSLWPRGVPSPCILMYSFAAYLNIFPFVYLVLILLMMSMTLAFIFSCWQLLLSLFPLRMEVGFWFLGLLFIPSVAPSWLVQPMNDMSYVGPPFLPRSMMSFCVTKTFGPAHPLLPLFILTNCISLLDFSNYFYMFFVCCLGHSHSWIRYWYYCYWYQLWLAFHVSFTL